MKTLINPSKEIFLEITRKTNTPFDNDLYSVVSNIMEDISRRGDTALAHYSKLFDGFGGPFSVDDDKIGLLISKVPESMQTAIKSAMVNIQMFHNKQLPSGFQIETTSEVICRERFVPIERVGIYIPGGTAPLISTVLMLAIPAKIAGCREIVLFTPPTAQGFINPLILFAAKLCGVTEIYSLGGVQAIGAMCLGFQTIRKVDKIFGPGNAYVTMAKQWAAARGIAIDMPAGPSEVAIIADESANVSYVAIDLLSQAEHAVDAQTLLLTNSKAFADEVGKAILSTMKKLKRTAIIEKALNNMFFVVLDSIDNCVDYANSYAPEHLIINCADADLLVEKVTNAGSIFVGEFAPESVGDYASGTNHTLPTGGAARSFGALGVTDFMKRTLIQTLTREGLKNLASTVTDLADAEGLDAHRMAVDIRLVNNC
jgi:histidinol dehydrogenase